MVLTGPELLNDRLFLAAEARVSGLSWEAAAKKQTMTGEELRKLAYDELPRWKELLREAERILLRETGYEALLILRNLMRNLDPKIARDCTVAFFKINMTNVRHRMKSRRKNSQPDDFPSDEVLSYDELGTSTSPSEKSSNAAVRRSTTEMIRQARIDPSTFLRYLLMAPGVRDPMAPVHTDLQNHLSSHRHALVELPRDQKVLLHLRPSEPWLAQVFAVEQKLRISSTPKSRRPDTPGRSISIWAHR